MLRFQLGKDNVNLVFVDIMLTDSFQQLLAVAVGLGVAKGFRSVYLNLVIPNYLPLERLPSASGIQMLAKGLVLIIFGPLLGEFIKIIMSRVVWNRNCFIVKILGVIRDKTGSYALCIAFINCLTFVTVTMWAIDVLWSKAKNQSDRGKEVN